MPTSARAGTFDFIANQIDTCAAARGFGTSGDRPLQSEVGSAHLVGGGVLDAPLVGASIMLQTKSIRALRRGDSFRHGCAVPPPSKREARALRREGRAVGDCPYGVERRPVRDLWQGGLGQERLGAGAEEEQGGQQDTGDLQLHW